MFKLKQEGREFLAKLVKPSKLDSIILLLENDAADKFTEDWNFVECVIEDNESIIGRDITIQFQYKDFVNTAVRTEAPSRTEFVRLDKLSPEKVNNFILKENGFLIFMNCIIYKTDYAVDTLDIRQVQGSNLRHEHLELGNLETHDPREFKLESYTSEKYIPVNGKEANLYWIKMM